MDPKELSDAYTRQLREWVERSEHTQKQLVALSAGVPLDDVLDETKLSRLIQEPPANVRRRRPLLKLLAVLYSLGSSPARRLRRFGTRTASARCPTA